MHGIHVTVVSAEEAALVDQLVAELALGRIRSVAFVVPSDVSMTSPLYDVAIATARRGWTMGIQDARYWFVTPEAEPVSAAASQSLEPEGITFVGSTFPDVHGRVVVLDPEGESIEVDRVVSLGHGGRVVSGHGPVRDSRPAESMRPAALAA